MDQHSEELAQLLEDFGESQEEIFSRVMEIRGEQQRTEPVAVPDSTEQVEPHPNSQERTTTPGDSADGTDRTPQPTTDPQTEETGESGPTTQREDDAMETPMAAE